MSISSWFPWKLGRQHKGRSRPSHSSGLLRRGTRLAVEQLEDRSVPASYTAATVPELIADINDANAHGGSNTITLVASTTFTLTDTVNYPDGRWGLPVIEANNDLTIQGNGDIIERSTASGTPSFGLVRVALGASLTLENVTLQGGTGGALRNEGTLDLKGVTVQNNGSSIWGGGIYSSGSLTLEAGTMIRNNGAYGDPGFAWYGYVSPGGNAYGGGVYIAGGTATLTDVTLSSNYVTGGSGATITSGIDFNASPGGNGYGGGLYVAGGAVTLTNVALTSNSAWGGGGLFGGNAYGGGVCVAGGTATMTNVTLSSNTAVGGSGGVSMFQERGSGGSGLGGGLAVVGGTVTLRSDTVTGNLAKGGAGSKPRYNGNSYGGGFYIDPAAAVYLDAFTLGHTKNNKPANIYGSYILIT